MITSETENQKMTLIYPEVISNQQGGVKWKLYKEKSGAKQPAYKEGKNRAGMGDVLWCQSNGWKAAHGQHVPETDKQCFLLQTK